MNILLINHYAGSTRHGMEYRPFYLAREWFRLGHQVTVAAASYSHVRSRQPDMVGAETREMIDGVDYRWLKTPTYSGNGSGRVANIATFLTRVSRRAAAWAAEIKPEVVIASSTYPLDIWVARKIARRCGAKLVYEVHDLWPLSPVEIGGMSRRHPFIQLCQKAENDAYRDADAVISMLPKVEGHMVRHGLDRRKLHIVPNGVVLDEWERAQPLVAGPLRDTLQAARDAGKTVVGYTGSHGKPNALDRLLDAARLMADEAFVFVLVGTGLEKARLEQRVASEGLTNVKMFPPVSKSQVPSLLRAVDMAYIGWERHPLYRFGIAPNKLLDYMMASRPVLHAVEAGNDPVAEAGCGLTVPPDSPEAIAEGLRRLAACSDAERERMGARGHRHVMARHTYPLLAQRFLEAVRPGASVAL
jgi:glycosyltransferase involved in cell wall biosynthesis